MTQPISHAESKVFIRHDSFLGFLRARGLDCTVAFDIGAFRGEWSKLVRRRWPAAEIFMFEALTEQKETLEAVANDLSSCHLINKPLGKNAGEEAYFTIWESLSGSSLLPQPGQKWDHLERRKVILESIDHLFAEGKLKIPELVKLDVQGAEMKVLESSSALFGKTEVFIIEASLYRTLGYEQPDALEIMMFMFSKGYVLFDFAGFYRRRVDHALHQADFVFVKKDSFLLTPGPLRHMHDFDW